MGSKPDAIENLGASTPLRFGDSVQIQALRFLREVSELKELARADKWVLCPACGGAGRHPECGECADDDPDPCTACRQGWLSACGLCCEFGLLDDDGEPPPIFSDRVFQAGVREAVIEWITTRPTPGRQQHVESPRC